MPCLSRAVCCAVCASNYRDANNKPAHHLLSANRLASYMTAMVRARPPPSRSCSSTAARRVVRGDRMAERGMTHSSCGAGRQAAKKRVCVGGWARQAEAHTSACWAAGELGTVGCRNGWVLGQQPGGCFGQHTHLVFADIAHCEHAQVWTAAPTASRPDLHQLLVPPDAHRLQPGEDWQTAAGCHEMREKLLLLLPSGCYCQGWLLLLPK